MKRTRASWLTALTVAAAVLAVGACSDSVTVAGPSATTPQLHEGVAQTTIVAGQLSYSISASLITAPVAGDVAICKTGTDASFQITIYPHLYVPGSNPLVPLLNPDGSPQLGPAITGWNANTVNLTNGTCIVFHGLANNEFTIIATEVESSIYAFAGLSATTINDLPGAVAAACDADTGTPPTDLEFCQIVGTRVTFGELNQHHGGLATFVNRPVGTLRVCKIAGSGVTVGTIYNFTIAIGTDPAIPFPLPAGTGTSATSPNCIEGPFEAGTRIVLQEVSIPAGVSVAITGGTVNSATNSTTVTIGAGLQTVLFTNSLVTPPPPPPPPPPAAGCTPGYYKTHNVPGDERTFASFGISTTGLARVGQGSGLVLETALDFGGGSGLAGAGRILLRAGAAALLNANLVAGYPMTEAQIVAAINSALTTGDREDILELAAELDRLNNLGCSLGNTYPQE